MARRNRGLFDEVVAVTVMLPWWVGVVFAVIAYLVFHQIAMMDIHATGQIKDVGGTIVKQVLKMLGTVGQYVVPVAFLIGALGSAFRQIKNKPKPIGELFAFPLEENVVPAQLEPKQKSMVAGDELNGLWKKPAAVAGVLRPDQWSLDLLRAMDWRRFEEVCAEYFRLCGFHAVTQSHGPDGGVDVKLYAPNAQSKLVNIVQCKQWNKPVGPKALREFLGVMTASRISRGVFVAASTFNDEATRFAAENRIHLLDGRRFLEKILDRPPADQVRLLQVATEGDYLTPSCPSCGIKLLKRERRKDKSVFWGCANFPRCRYILNT